MEIYRYQNPGRSISREEALKICTDIFDRAEKERAENDKYNYNHTRINNISEIIGKWPGDESDAEFDELIKEHIERD
jgi:hypothetical protein